jgi:sec-independent protein translocase protein TatA
MGSFSIWHLIVVLIVALLLFGSGRVADVGKGLGEGIRNFKKGIREDEDDPDQKQIVVKKKVAPEDEGEAPQLTAKKKKVIQIEVDDDADEEEIMRKLAKKAADKDEKTA